MLISVVCPACRESYKVHEALRGKSMRCLRPTCRRVFLIDDSPPPTMAPHAPPTQRGQHVGDVLPLLPAEHAEPPAPDVGNVFDMLPVESAEAAPLPMEMLPPDSAQAAPDWATAAPPPRRSRPKVPVIPTTPDESTRILHGGWEPPPVRAEPEPEPMPVAERFDSLDEVDADRPPPRRARRDPDPVPEHQHEDEPVARPRSRWAKWIILPFVFLTTAALAVGVVLLVLSLRKTEEQYAREADAAFDNNQFHAAAEQYDALLKKYSTTSEYLDRYTYRRDLANLRKRLAEPSGDLIEELTFAEQLYTERAKDPNFPPDARALGDVLVKVLTDFASNAARDPKDDAPLATLDRAEGVIKLARGVELPPGEKPPAWSQAEDAFRGVRVSVARMKERQKILAALKAKALPTYRGMLDVEDYLREVLPNFPELADSPEVRRIRDEQIQGHLASVRYVAQAEKLAPTTDEQEPALLLDPFLVRPVAVGGRDDVGLALVRGVLYGVSKSSGAVRWARRLGIDTTTLPVRVPGREGIPERLLVLSSDTRSLTALSLDGIPLWRHQFKTPVLGRPVVIGNRRAYLATYEGEVHEIELVEGRLLGRFVLGQPLTLGGTREATTNRIYFPADGGCVYLLDVAEKRCERILYTRHPAGSLRGEVIVAPPAGDEVPGFLILNQADGLDSVRLRVYDLPIRDGNVPERTLQPPAALEGWTWFDPHQDPEKLILLSDAGRLGLFGIQQAHNRDQPLFALLPQGSFDLKGLLDPKGSGRLRGRSEIVRARSDELWALASGKLQRLRFAWGAAQGPMLVGVWREPLEVGSPLHASQHLEGVVQSSLITVTQPTRRSCTWISSINDDNGTLQWRRQLGLVCQGPPLPLPMPQGEPVWVACDQAGALFALDPTTAAPLPGTSWFTYPRSVKVLLAGSLEDNPAFAPRLLLAEDKKSAYALACPGNGLELVIRHVKPGDERELDVTEAKVPLGMRLAGDPVLVGSHLMLPLADGSLARVRVPLAAETLAAESGLNWRDDRADAQSHCHVGALSDERFVMTDGRRGLNVCEWKAGSNSWAILPRDGNPPTLEMPDRVVGLTVLPGAMPRVVVSDVARTLTLLYVQGDGTMQIKRTWKLSGPVTTGPFVRQTPGGVRVGCIVDRTRLVWINPEANSPLWVYESPDEAPLVEEPTLVGDSLLIADQAGRYVALDPATGTPRGPGYQLRGSLAAATSPVPFGTDRLLAPLSDGTLMLLATQKVMGK